ncbi:hypothetical protein FQN55_003189 [Onygenales sp. PD_40]|nr:hypothetical protein FQN55_003189 [Onygenales sp. PD_40]
MSQQIPSSSTTGSGAGDKDGTDQPIEPQGTTTTSPETPSSMAASAAAAERKRPNALQEIFSLSRFVTGAVTHPLENIRYVSSMMRQMGSKLIGRKGFDPETDIGDLSGRVVLVTGGTSGLGKQTILQLSKHNPATIYLAARSESKALSTIAEIKSSLPPTQSATLNLQHLPLDLSSFASIRAAATLFTSSSKRLHTLILNAGVMALDPDTTSDGYEIQFGTNFLGHFLLTKLLLPTLLETANSSPHADVRVISISSWAWQMAPLPCQSPLQTMTSTPALLASNTWTRYGCSKAANAALAAQLARLYPEQITAVSVHPGLIHTNLYGVTEEKNPVVRVGVAAVAPLLTGEREGALGHLWAVGVGREVLRGPDGRGNGGYFEPVGVRARNWFVEDEGVGRGLWEWAEGEVRGWVGDD